MDIIKDKDIVAYATTVDGTVHGVVWATVMGNEELYFACMRRRAPTSMRTAANPEQMTCIACLSFDPGPELS